MAYVFLDFAVIGTTGLELSNGFTRAVSSGARIVFNVAAPNFLLSA